MIGTTSPTTLLLTQIDTLRGQLPGIADGRIDAIHDGRIATRRIRELLALVHGPHEHHASQLIDVFRRLSRSLGRVRDTDVQIALLTGLESHTPPAGAAIVFARHAHERRRAKRMRRVIKTMEALEIEQVLRPQTARGMAHLLVRPGWPAVVTRRVQARAIAGSEAVAHATGVYFPKRLHRARIAVKKARYACEIAEATSLADFASEITLLKKTQSCLGDVHDRQVLLEDMQALDGDDVGRESLELVSELLEAEIQALHRQYLQRRQELCVALERARAIGRRLLQARLTTAVRGALVASAVVYGGTRMSRALRLP